MISITTLDRYRDAIKKQVCYICVGKIQCDGSVPSQRSYKSSIMTRKTEEKHLCLETVFRVIFSLFIKYLITISSQIIAKLRMYQRKDITIQIPLSDKARNDCEMIQMI